MVHLVGITLATPLILLLGAAVSHLVIGGDAFRAAVADHPPRVRVVAPMAVLFAIHRPAFPGRPSSPPLRSRARSASSP